MKTNRIPSGAEQAKLDRELVELLKAESTPNESNESEPVGSGLKNPCVFGKHNPNFYEKKTI